jgi:hypothetical protein
MTNSPKTNEDDQGQGNEKTNHVENADHAGEPTMRKTADQRNETKVSVLNEKRPRLAPKRINDVENAVSQKVGNDWA